MLDAGNDALATRVDEAKGQRVGELLAGVDYDPVARTAVWTAKASGTASTEGPAPADAAVRVAVVTAGTSDEPVAAEAVRTLEFLGVEVDRIRDVGVAGLHRVLVEQPGTDHEPGAIVTEITRGYRLHDRLLREAQVVVAARPAEGAAEPDGV